VFSVYVKVIATLWQLWILKKGKFLNMFSVTIGKFLNRIVAQWIDKYIYLECEPPGLKSKLLNRNVAQWIDKYIYLECEPPGLKSKFLNRNVAQWIDKYIYLECEPPGLKSLLTTSLGVACSISANVYSENFKQQDSCT
jgi:hypothetical protein